MLQTPFPPSSFRMGVGSSLLPVDFDSKLSSAEISRLSKRFKKLDTDKSGTLNFQELLELPQIKQNPLAKRIVGKLLIHIFVNPCTFIIFKIYSEVLDHDGSGELDFEEFVSGMSKFSSSEDREAKLRFAFKIYDIDNDGFISNGELYQVIK